MCVFNRPSPPPPLPEPTPTAPRPEPTARRVVIGDQRSRQRQRPGGTRRGRRSRMLGTASLQIPLLNQEQMGSGNLNY